MFLRSFVKAGSYEQYSKNLRFQRRTRAQEQQDGEPENWLHSVVPEHSETVMGERCLSSHPVGKPSPECPRKPYKANFKGHEWHLQPGQLVVTAADLGLQLCDRHGKPASRDQVERMLQVFVKEGMISIDGEKQKGRVITITNYHEYAQKMDDSSALEAAQTTAHDAAHDEASNGAAFSVHAAHESAHEAAQTTAHHEQEGINKNINNTPLPPNGGGDGQVKPERRKAERIDYESFLNAYNTEVGDRLPHAVAVNEKRKRRLKKIIPQLKTPNVDGFRAYVRAFVHQAKPFYFGDNDTGWTADFDYLLREDSLTGVREGKFADRGIA